MYDFLRGIMNSGSVWGSFVQIIPIVLLTGIVYAVCRLIYLEQSARSSNAGKEAVNLMFVCYLSGLFNLVVMPANFWLGLFDAIFFGWRSDIKPLFSPGGFNLIPAAVKWLRGELTFGVWVRQMLIGNILMFVPLGFFLPFVSKRINKRNIFILAALIPLAVELVQTVFGRSFDTDDLICNFAGILTGFYAAGVVKR